MTNGRGRDVLGEKLVHHKPTQVLIQGSHFGKPSNDRLRHCTAHAYGTVHIFKIFHFRTTSDVSDNLDTPPLFRKKSLEPFQIFDQ